MNIVENTLINVYNYSDSVCVVSSNIKPEGYLFEAANNNMPFSIPLTFSEIRVINSQSDIFRNGILRFDKEFEKDVYEALAIRDWKNILTDEEIRDIILNPTPEGVKKIIAITNPAMFERVRGIFIQLKNTNMYDISMRIATVINERYKELYRGQRNSAIKVSINNTNNQNKNSQTDISKIIQSELEKAKEELKKQLEQQIREQLETEYKARLEEKQKEDVKVAEKPKTNTTSNTKYKKK